MSLKQIPIVLNTCKLRIVKGLETRYPEDTWFLIFPIPCSIEMLLLQYLRYFFILNTLALFNP